MDPKWRPIHGLKALMDHKQTKTQKIKGLVQAWIHGLRTSNPYHMHMRHDLIRVMMMWIWWIRWWAWALPKWIRVSVKPRCLSQLLTCMGLQASEVRVSKAYLSIKVLEWNMILLNPVFNIWAPNYGLEAKIRATK